MIAMIQSWIALIAPYWPWVKALLIALLFSWSATQLLKYCWRLVKASIQFAPTDEHEKLYLRLLATVLCFIPLYQLWPDKSDNIWVAVVMSLLSPTIYKIITHWAYKRYPILEEALSANPHITIRRDEDGNITGIKEGDDPTEFVSPKTEPKENDDEETTVPKGDGGG